LALVDLQYADIRTERGLAHRLESRGLLDRLVTDEEVRRAVEEPPDDTRAYFRGECVRRFPQAVVAASWDSVVMDIGTDESLVRIPTLDPHRGTRAHVGELLDASTDPVDLVRRLERSP